MLVLAFVLPASAQYLRVVDQMELFNTKVCSLGGVPSSFVNNPNNAYDSCFAWSNTITLTVPVYGPSGFVTNLWANRAWLEVAYSDSETAGAGLSTNDSLECFIYGGGPGNAETNAIIDTLIFVMPTGAKNKTVIKEITPYFWPDFCQSGVATNYHFLDLISAIAGDSAVLQVSHLPYEMKFRIHGTCST
jgi:hypothetical protein